MTLLRANLRSSGKRLWGAGIAIAISVAFIVTGSILVDGLTRALTQEAEAEAAGTDLVVTTEYVNISDWENEPETVADGDVILANRVAELDGVAAAESVRRSWLDVFEGQSSMQVGMTVESLVPSRAALVQEGDLPSTAEEILLTPDAAESYGLDQGQQISVTDDFGTADSYESSAVDYTISGIADVPGVSGALLLPEGMDRLAGAPSPLHIRVVLDDAQTGDPQAQQQVQKQIAALTEAMISAGDVTVFDGFADDDAGAVPTSTGPHGQLTVGGVEIATHQQIVDTWVEEQTGSADALRNIALVFGALAAFVATMVITNTFQVIVASRMRTMALIRAVGGTTGQLRRATIAEGAILGLVGGVAGVLTGWGLAHVLGLAARAAGFDQLAVGVPGIAAITLGLGLGVVMAVVSSVYPAYRAGKVSPMVALRPADLATPHRRVPVWRVTAGSVMAVLGLAGTAYAGATGLHPENFGSLAPLLATGAGILAALGLLLLAKVFVPPLVGKLGAAASALPGLGVIGRLAGRNARQVPGRTAATASALLIGVTLVMTMLTGAATAQKVLFNELSSSNPVDGMVSTTGAEIDEVLDGDSAVAEFASLPGVMAQAEREEAATESADLRVLVVDDQAVNALFYDSEAAPAEGELLVSYASDLAPERTYGEEPEDNQGSHVQVGSADQQAADDSDSATLRSVGADWLPPEVAIMSSASLPAGWDAEESDGATLVRFTDGFTSVDVNTVLQDLRSAGAEAEFMGAELRAGFVEVIDMVLLVILGLLAASVVVAVIGVSNTLSLSVFERGREAALLRALGMSRRRVGTMISVEAVLIASVVLLVGTALGLFFGWAGVSSLIPREDWTVSVAIPWGRLTLVWLVTVLAALAAAWLPSRRLRRTQPAAGLSRAA